jgi:2'-5' RNA ligase
MPYAIELYFDATTEARIRGLWGALESIGAATMREGDARPHVSLAVCGSIEVPAAGELLDRFAKTVESFPLTFASVGMFCAAAPIVFLAPKVTMELLVLHERFFAELQKVSRDCWRHYEPAQWVPHCTLAMELAQDKIARTIGIGQGAGLPFTGVVSEIGLVEFRPVRQLHVARLGEGRKRAADESH